MEQQQMIDHLVADVERELKENILQFWIDHTIDTEHGGFYGRITNAMQIDRSAPKSLVLNSRILWTFSRAYNFYRAAEYLAIAERAYKYLIDAFWDQEFGGFYWMVDARGHAIQKHKQVYGEVFGVYALSEYYKAIHQTEALTFAQRIYEKLERHAFDPAYNGYVEALSQNWQATDRLRLSAQDLNEKKSMNTHLHLLEAYTNLYSVWNDQELGHKLKNAIDIMIEKILDHETLHFVLFFDEYWHSKSDTISFGHEIEGTWLIYDAVTLLNDEAYRKKVERIILDISDNVYQYALENSGNGQWLVNEQDGSGKRDPDKVWWVQAEACVGFFNAYQLTGKEYFLEAVYKLWNFIQEHCVDNVHGEWFSYISENGEVNNNRDKVEAWKGPYHNARVCIELLERIKGIQHANE